MTKKKTGTAKPPPAIVREYLAELASALPHLVEHEKRLKASGRTFAATISAGAAEIVLAALAKFEAGERLDRAFGLTPRGRPPLKGPEAKNYKLAKDVFWMRMENVDWKVIARRCGRNIRYLQRLMEQYKDDIIAEASATLAAINSAEWIAA